MDAREVAACASCQFWEHHHEDLLAGDCRRRAPRLAGMAAPHGNATYQEPRAAMWPETMRDDWCGEYEVRAHLLGEG